MVRYAPDHKDLTRRRVVEAAGRRFKRDGIDGSGITALVADAGLTNGAFYGHFKSKDDLVATVIADQLATQCATIERLPATPAALETFIRDYLSPRHRDDPAGGCPSAALLDEISRCDNATRKAFTDGIKPIVELITQRLETDTDHTASDRAIGLFTLLISSLQMARAVTDTELSDRILTAGLRNALALTG